MTCENCLHYEDCKRTNDLIDEAYNCFYFLEKDKYIELPCKVGDTVYTVDSGYAVLKIRKYAVKQIEVYSDDVVLRFGSTVAYSVKAVGKTVFLTNEEAEQRLKELQKNTACDNKK